MDLRHRLEGEFIFLCCQLSFKTPHLSTGCRDLKCLDIGLGWCLPFGIVEELIDPGGNGRPRCRQTQGCDAMLEFGLFFLTWQLDPARVNGSNGNGSATITTCVRPHARTVEPDADHSTLFTRADDVDGIMPWLKKWEQLTSGHPTWNRSRKEEFRRSIQREINEHTAFAAEQLVGHVSSDTLIETYQWKVVDRTETRVTLEAIPRDETDRLFYRSFRISLNVGEGVPDQIVVVCRNEQQRIVWQSSQPSDADRIQLVNYRDDAPPAPKRLIKTADSRID
jgi:hypothetical protein